VSRLLLFNFGTFQETNRFKQRALADGFLESDAMDDNAPSGALTVAGGVQKRASTGATVSSFYGLRPDVWAGKASSGRPYSAEFQTWMAGVLGRPVHCVYLTGHHEVLGAYAAIYWDLQGQRVFYTYLGKVGELVFGVFDKTTKQAADKVAIETANLRAECLLVLGFGCNVGAPNQSTRYQGYFANGAKKPIVLGWATTMEVPSAGSSVNAGFFDYLADYAKKNSSVPAKHRLRWFYDNQPMEVIRAWGRGVFGLQGKSSETLRAGARARHHDGTYYRFEAKDGRAEPVKI
jgi:hypothetical protein